MNRFGIRFNLPEGDTLSASHLLGDAFEYFRWYETADERDAAYDDLSREHDFSRSGDKPTVVMAKVEQ
jgi:hypothetical protein